MNGKNQRTWRLTPVKSACWANTVFGPELVTKYCPCCKQDKVLGDFYARSGSQNINPECLTPGRMRHICQSCWNDTNGKYKDHVLVISTESQSVLVFT